MGYIQMIEVRNFRVAIRCEMCGDTRPETGERYSDSESVYYSELQAAIENGPFWDRCDKCTCQTLQKVVGYSSEPK